MSYFVNLSKFSEQEFTFRLNYFESFFYIFYSFVPIVCISSSVKHLSNYKNEKQIRE